MFVFNYFASIGIETTVTITLKKKRELAESIQLFNILFRKRLRKNLIQKFRRVCCLFHIRIWLHIFIMLLSDSVAEISISHPDPERRPGQRFRIRPVGGHTVRLIKRYGTVLNMFFFFCGTYLVHPFAVSVQFSVMFLIRLFIYAVANCVTKIKFILDGNFLLVFFSLL